MGRNISIMEGTRWSTSRFHLLRYEGNLTLVSTRHEDKSIFLSDLLLVYAFTFSLATCSLESRGGFDDFVVILSDDADNCSHTRICLMMATTFMLSLIG
jgi:hypothetical protein